MNSANRLFPQADDVFLVHRVNMGYRQIGPLHIGDVTGRTYCGYDWSDWVWQCLSPRQLAAYLSDPDPIPENRICEKCRKKRTEEKEVDRGGDP